MNNNELIITLIFAAVAAFVLFKLRSVLGRRTGHEQQRDGFGNRSSTTDNVVQMPDRRSPETVDVAPGSPLEAGIAEIRSVDPSFDPAEFLAGAKAAFEMIVTAFAQGDRETLRPLLGDEVFASFDEAIRDREQAGQTMELTFMGFKSAEVTRAELQDGEARVTVKFVTEQSSAIRNASGDLTDGDPAEVETVTDVWTFARDARSRDPNWELVETDSSE